MVALGKIASGLFGQPDEWVNTVRSSSQRAGDRCWPMPLYDEYSEQLRSEIADIDEFRRTAGRRVHGGDVPA